MNSGFVNVVSLAIKDTSMFAGTDEGVYSSIDNGVNWTAVNNGLPAFLYVTSMALIDSTLFAGTYYGPFLTTDNGASWAASIEGFIGSNVRSLSSVGGKIFATSLFGGLSLTTEQLIAFTIMWKIQR